MTFDDIEAAVATYLLAMADCPPIAWPNRPYTPEVGTAYIEFRHAPNTRQDDTGDGIGAIQTGLFLLTVVAPDEGGAKVANDIAQAIADRFPKTLRLTAGSGKVVFNAPASLAPPFTEGVYWRQPVRLSYVTE